MEVRILGPVEVVGDEGSLPLAAMPRRLLGALLVRAGETCSTDLLIDALWGEAQPASASKLLQVYVSQLRKALAAGVSIDTGGGGYVLKLEGESLDAARFERLFGEGRQAVGANPALAASLLRRALSLWRGAAFGEFAYDEFARPEAERLEELRRACLEEWLDAELALGHHAEHLPQLQSLAAAEPLRERPQAQAMLALYRCGRQTEALDVYNALRTRLRDELGLEPSAELRELQRRILQHDPALDVPVDNEESLLVLPAAPNRLLGRERELEDLCQLLVRGDVRLLVLTGAGGSGKTRLALEAARKAAASFANGAGFVDLAPVRDPELVLSTIGRRLGIDDVAGEDALETVAAALRAGELLLVLDNAEHLRAAAPSYVELLARAPRLTMLVTSRAVLHVSGEHVYPVEPLGVDAAVALFLERAHAAEPRFQPDAEAERAIRRICERLDGLPLAVELAAGHIRALTPSELLARLESRLPLLAGGPRDLPARQQTLRATLAWSYDLLTAEQQRILRSLSIFAGGFTLEAAVAVCASDEMTALQAIEDLVSASLVVAERQRSTTRWRLLETVREYLDEQLAEVGETDAARRAQVDWLLTFVDQGVDVVRFHDPEVIERVIQRVEPEISNIRASIGWLTENGEHEQCARLLREVWPYWTRRGPLPELRRWLEDTLYSTRLPPRLRLDILFVLCQVTRVQGDGDRSRAAAEEALALSRRLDPDSPLVIEALRDLGIGYGMIGEFEQAIALHEQALAETRKRGYHDRRVTILLGNLGWLELERGNSSRSREFAKQELALAQELGDSRDCCSAMASIGATFLMESRFTDAKPLFLEALNYLLKVGSARPLPVLPELLESLADVAAGEDEPIRAAKLLGGADVLRNNLGTSPTDTEAERLALLVTRIRNALDEQTYEGTFAEGAALTADQAIAYALDAGAETGDAVPTGVTRTFMFTDIARSTSLVDAIGDDAWRDLLRWHDQTLRDLFAAHQGKEVDHPGDGFFVAFAEPRRAVQCAMAIQRRLAEHRRKNGFAPAVRIGLHIADALADGSAYRGRGVHEASRIAARAQGGEILASEAVVNASQPISTSTPREVQLRGITSPFRVATINS